MTERVIDQIIRQDRLEGVQGGEHRILMADCGEWIEGDLAAVAFYEPIWDQFTQDPRSLLDTVGDNKVPPPPPDP